MRTGPFFPSLAMASSRILYCPKIFMEIFSQKFPEVSFEIFPTGRIVDLDWQSWPEDEFPNWINEIEDYIICNPHSESLSQKIGNFYRIVIPFGARVSYFRIAPENREGMSDNLKTREIHDSYGAVDRNTWNGMPIFTAQNNVILLSEIGVKRFQKFGLEDLFEFEEYLDKDTWYEKRSE
ncbi:MAG: hypothetical protein Q4A17_15315 [Thermoguttaceae bacterium]|nr:hypothetical protein [Thermoguttaceae bacterium]